MQSLRDDGLSFLGREHSADEATDACVGTTHFDRLSIDLIYTRRDQSLPGWRDELHQALDLGITHMSVYQLTIEPGTVFSPRTARRDTDHGG